MSKQIKVCFIKPGTPYGYGYAAGEYGLVLEKDFKDSKRTDEKGVEHVKKGLQSRGVARASADAEYEEFISGVKAAEQARKAKEPKPVEPLTAEGLAALIAGATAKAVKPPPPQKDPPPPAPPKDPPPADPEPPAGDKK